MHYERGREMLRVLALLATWVGEDTQQNPFKVFPGEVLGMGEPRECCPWRAEQSRACPFIPFMDTHPVCSSSSLGVPWAKWELLQQSPSWGGKKNCFKLMKFSNHQGATKVFSCEGCLVRMQNVSTTLFYSSHTVFSFFPLILSTLPRQCRWLEASSP